MQDWETLGRELQRSGKGDALKKLADSKDAKALGGMLDAEAVRQAAKSGDTAALKTLLGGVLATEEGQRLARELRKMMKG